MAASLKEVNIVFLIWPEEQQGLTITHAYYGQEGKKTEKKKNQKKQNRSSPAELKCMVIYLDMCRLGAESILNSAGDSANTISERLCCLQCV